MIAFNGGKFQMFRAMLLRDKLGEHLEQLKERFDLAKDLYWSSSKHADQVRAYPTELSEKMSPIDGIIDRRPCALLKRSEFRGSRSNGHLARPVKEDKAAEAAGRSSQDLDDRVEAWRRRGGG